MNGERKCEGCGHMLEPGQKKCPECGMVVKQQEARDVLDDVRTVLYGTKPVQESNGGTKNLGEDHPRSKAEMQMQIADLARSLAIMEPVLLEANRTADGLKFALAFLPRTLEGNGATMGREAFGREIHSLSMAIDKIIESHDEVNRITSSLRKVLGESLESIEEGKALPTEGSVDRTMALRLIWNKTHKDYKGGGSTPSARRILVLRTGGTHSVPLDDLSDDEVKSMLPKGFTLGEEEPLPNYQAMLSEADIIMVSQVADDTSVEKADDPPTIAKLRAIVRDRQAAKVGGVMVDGFSAAAAVQVYDKVNDENKARLAHMPVRRMMDLVFRLISQRKA